MSCGPAETSFRLLDAYVGWDEDSVDGVAGLDDAGGLYLRPVDLDAIGPGELDARVSPRQLAHGCGGCEWFLAAASEPPALLVRTGCGAGFRAVRFAPAAWRPTAVAAWGSLVAVVDGAGEDARAWLVDVRRGRAGIRLDVPGAVAVALSAGGVIVAGAHGVDRFDPSGAFVEHAALPGPGAVDRVAVDARGDLWLVLAEGDTRRVWRFPRRPVPDVPRAACVDQSAFDPPHAATAAELAGGFPALGVHVGRDGFCLDEPGPRGVVVTGCFGWDGTPRDVVGAAASGPSRLPRGTLRTRALDSGQPRCRWHRVRVDAELPPDSSLLVEVASTEDAAVAPHDDDWTGAGPGRTDFLVEQPPGRFLFVRLTLTGDGHATPHVRRVRLDLPRATSLDHLPEVYREDPEAAEFSERFLSLFDAQIDELDRAIERFPALLDSGGVPDEVVPWLGGLLGVAFDPAWEPARRRALLDATPELYRQRGTVAGLRRAIQLVLGVDPVIEEVAAGRAYGAVGEARLGTVRLFGRSRARFRVGSSPLGRAPVRSYGNPDDDVVRAGAYRLRVRVPPVPGATREQAQARLRRLVEAQKPAHVAVDTSVGGGAGTLGAGLVLGVDTIFLSPPAPVLGRAGNIRLSRASVLWRARREL